MDVSTLIGVHLNNVFQKTNSFMCIYDCNNDSIVKINPSMLKNIGETTCIDINVNVIFSSEKQKYITLNGIPCKLVLLSYLDNNLYLMDMYPSHTKKWNQKTDIVSLTDMVSDGVWEWFPEIDFEYMSERFWKILGYEQKNMEETPMSWMDFLNPEDKEPTFKMFKNHVESRGNKPYISKVRYQKKDGTEVIILCRGSVVDWMPNGKPWRLLGTHTDITDIVKKDSVEAKSKFISRMSHEIRSPICTILNECELLNDVKKTSVITDTCKQLISIADNILDIEKINTEQFELNITCQNISQIISKCVKRHNLEAKKAGLRIRTILDELPETLSIDLGKFNQVLDNLIGNSIKYSEKGSIIIDIEYDRQSEVCSIRISDNGIGIDPSFHVNAFEELVQGDNTSQGAGIGLSLCRRIANSMNGNVIIEESSLGNGTTILFTSILPICEDNCNLGPGSDSTFSVCPSNIRVLVVDDMRTNRSILKRRLQGIKDIGMVEISDIVEAVDGLDAVSKFSECSGDFQLVLMDCHMPILNGFDATVKIHECCSEFGIEPVPVVAVTASVSTDVYDKCLSSGMKYVVTKPYSELDLMASIQSSMGID